MDDYRQYCPVAKAHEILGERWTMLIVRELVGGRATFSDIARGLPGISRSLLTDRLRRLEAKGVLRRVGEKPSRCRYELTPAGEDLRPVVEAFGKWGARWAFGPPRETELDPGLLLWRMKCRLNRAALPDRRLVIHFDFRTGKRGHFWFVIEDGEASVCLTDPGFDIDLRVSAELSALYQVWLGRKSLAAMRRSRNIVLAGTPSLERAFDNWFLRRPMSSLVEQAMSGKG